MFLLISAEGDDDALIAELGRTGVTGTVAAPGLVTVDAATLPVLALARQTLPDAEAVIAPSVSAWARALFERIRLRLPEGAPWRLHVLARYGVQEQPRMGARAWHTARRASGSEPRATHDARRQGERATANDTARHERTPDRLATNAGEHRCQLIADALHALLKERRRSLLRSHSLATGPFAEGEALVQVVLSSPETGWISISAEPARLYPWISPFVGGELPIAVDPAPPSRAFAKLVEAELRLGRRVQPGETGVDLGASPGGWTWVALERGATVTAVDRSPLRDDLMRHPRLHFVKGDAFGYHPPTPVDWLWCDVIAAPERSIAMLLDWLRAGHARWFVVTLKLKGDHAALDPLKAALPGLADRWFLTHLCANKGEACVFGRR